MFAGEILGTRKYSERKNTTREGINIDGDMIYKKLLEKEMTLNRKTLLEENKSDLKRK